MHAGQHPIKTVTVLPHAKEFFLSVHSLDVYTFAGDHDHFVKVPADGITQALEQRPGSWVGQAEVETKAQTEVSSPSLGWSSRFQASIFVTLRLEPGEGCGGGLAVRVLVHHLVGSGPCGKLAVGCRYEVSNLTGVGGAPNSPSNKVYRGGCG